MVKLGIVPRRRAYLRSHWLEVLVVVVPFFWPLRIARIFIFGSQAWVGFRRQVNVDFLLVYGVGLVVIAATVAISLEGGTGASIHSFADALWWAFVTIATVGYGDMVPVTLVGKAIAVVLMLGGVAFFNGVTANLASFLIKGRGSEEKDLDRLAKEAEGLRQEMLRWRPE